MWSIHEWSIVQLNHFCAGSNSCRFRVLMKTEKLYTVAVQRPLPAPILRQLVDRYLVKYNQYPDRDGEWVKLVTGNFVDKMMEVQHTLPNAPVIQEALITQLLAINQLLISKAPKLEEDDRNTVTQKLSTILNHLSIHLGDEPELI